MLSFLHTFEPQPIAFQLGFIRLYWYGIFMVLGIFFGIFLLLWLAKKYGIDRDSVYDFAFYLVIFSLLGARIYAVLLFPSHYSENPLEIVQVWKGGLAIHGAVIAGMLTLWWYARKKQQPFWLWADMLVLSLSFGQVLGRWGNYFNQELFGTPTNAPWGIPIEPQNIPQEFQGFTHFHPTFLYESILNFCVFLVILFLHTRRMRDTDKQTRKYGNIALVYLILYSFVRIAMEQFRIDETPVFLGLRFPVFISIVIISASIAFLFQKNSKKSKNTAN